MRHRSPARGDRGHRERAPRGQRGPRGAAAQLRSLGFASPSTTSAPDTHRSATSSGFPFDKIKIDRTFVDDLDRSRDSAAIVAAVISLGRSLGVSITAEGVETEEQLLLLAALQCDTVQGFLFGRPKPAEDLRAAMERARGGRVIASSRSSGSGSRPRWQPSGSVVRSRDGRTTRSTNETLSAAESLHCARHPAVTTVFPVRTVVKTAPRASPKTPAAAEDIRPLRQPPPRRRPGDVIGRRGDRPAGDGVPGSSRRGDRPRQRRRTLTPFRWMTAPPRRT